MMNLSPEEREDARADYREVSRRDFLKGGVAAGTVAAGGMGAFYFGYGKAEGEPVRVGVVGTGDEGCVLIGAINPEYIEVRSIADIRPYNIHRAMHGDHYSPAAAAVRPGLMDKYGWQTEAEARKHVNVYEGEQGDYRNLIANAKADGIEAIIIGLPLHLHAKAAIAAMRAGLHVLTEKLMAHSVYECKEMARAAKLQGKHLATGHQRHYNILYEDAVDTIKRGVLGDLHYIRAQWHRGNMPGTDSWQQPMPQSVKPDDPLAEKLAKELKSWEGKLAKVTGRDIDVWAKKVAQKRKQIEDVILADLAEGLGYEHKVLEGGGQKYDRPAIEELIRWRLWDRTGGGLMVELGSHQLDAASIFISAVHGGVKQHPLNVMAVSNRPIFPMDREADDHVCCIYEFAAPGYNGDSVLDRRRKIGVQYASINGNGYGGYGEMVFGTKGTLILEREQDVMLYRGPSASKVKTSAGGPTMDTQASGAVQKAEVTGPANVSRGYTEEIEHWAWCIRRNPNNLDPDIQPRCKPQVAMADAVVALVTNISASKGERIEFDQAWFDPDSDETPEGVKPDVSRYA